MTDTLIKLFDRDLSRLQQEAGLIKEENLWKTTGTIKNPAGNLCLHLIGNLNTYIGKNIGGIPYTRDRDAEFTNTDVPQQQLMKQVEATKDVVLSVLRNMSEASLKEKHVENVLGFEMTNEYFLMHLAMHLAYHLGQVNYIRRALE
jgi:hypothetical protein